MHNIHTYPGVHVLVEPLWLHYGESKDPGKMTHTGIACIKRGLSAKPASSKSHAEACSLEVQASDQQVSSQAYQRTRSRSHAAEHTPFADTDRELADVECLETHAA